MTEAVVEEAHIPIHKYMEVKKGKMSLNNAEQIVREVHEAYKRYVEGVKSSVILAYTIGRGPEGSHVIVIEISIMPTGVCITTHHTKHTLTKSFDSIRDGIEAEVGLVNESTEDCELRIFGLTIPVSHCSMGPCRDCITYLDCKKGGYRI